MECPYSWSHLRVLGIVDPAEAVGDVLRTGRVERVVDLEAVDAEGLLAIVDAGEAERLDVTLRQVLVMVAHRLAESVIAPIEEEVAGGGEGALLRPRPSRSIWTRTDAPSTGIPR